MLDFSDPRWAGMKGGYKILFDPRQLLMRLERERDVGPVWSELWNELHHRGALDWNAYAIVSVIELARNHNENPDVPGWIKDEYFNAIHALAERESRSCQTQKILILAARFSAFSRLTKDS
jgi:hypothetical protein